MSIRLCMDCRSIESTLFPVVFVFFFHIRSFWCQQRRMCRVIRIHNQWKCYRNYSFTLNKSAFRIFFMLLNTDCTVLILMNFLWYPFLLQHVLLSLRDGIRKTVVLKYAHFYFGAKLNVSVVKYCFNSRNLRVDFRSFGSVNIIIRLLLSIRR